MPENDQTDPFADLYGRLPDPRAGRSDATPRADGSAATPSEGTVPQSQA